MANLRVTITPEGRAFRQELAEGNNFEQLDNMRYLWILDQYIKGSSSPMTGPVMGPEFEVLVDWGYLNTEVM